MGNKDHPDKLPFRMTPVIFHVLLAMVDGEIHGYRIMRDVAKRTHGSVTIGPGSLYWTLGRLSEAGMIEESSQRPDTELDDTRRKYYGLTEYGRRVLASEVSTLAEIVDFARRLNVFGSLEAGS